MNFESDAFKEGMVKHIYFVAETKGSMSSLELRPLEKSKIVCAKKLFNQLSDEQFFYHEVTNYDDLMEWVKELHIRMQLLFLLFFKKIQFKAKLLLVVIPEDKQTCHLSA